MQEPGRELWLELVSGNVPAIRVSHSDCIAYDDVATSERPGALFPGSFNPLHAGHAQIARVAREILGDPIEFELSIANVDKPELTEAEVARRLARFANASFPPETRVWITRSCKFVQKAKLFPSARFVVGLDTIDRVADATYHQHDWDLWRQAIQEITNDGCSFLVFGRISKAGFETLADRRLPEPLHSICRGVSAKQFRRDVSSSEIRSSRG